MPGYILHLTEATMILKELQKRSVVLDPDSVNRFFLGSLLPDTKIKREKAGSHFWNPDRMEHLAIAPDLNRFVDAYGSACHGPEMIGYAAHLHLDHCFVEEYWRSVFSFLDEENKEAVLAKDITTVFLKEHGKSIEVSRLFSGEYYYGDYSKMNAYLMERFPITIPVFRELESFPITEVDPKDLIRVLSELKYLSETVQHGMEQQLSVFHLDTLLEFIKKTAEVMSRKIEISDQGELYLKKDWQKDCLSGFSIEQKKL